MIMCPTLEEEMDSESDDAHGVIQYLLSNNHSILCITVDGKGVHFYSQFCEELEELGFKVVHTDVNQNTQQNTLTFWYKEGTNKYTTRYNENCSCCGFLNLQKVTSIEEFINKQIHSIPFSQVIMVRKDVFDCLENVYCVQKLAVLKDIDEEFVLFQYIRPDDVPNMNASQRLTYVASAIQEANPDKLIHAVLKEYRGLELGKSYRLITGSYNLSKAKIKSLERFGNSVRTEMLSTNIYGSVYDYCTFIKDDAPIQLQEVK